LFERFTERARMAVVFAQDEARLLGHNYVGTEHIALALFEAEGKDGPLHRMGADRDRFESDLVTALEPYTKA